MVHKGKSVRLCVFAYCFVKWGGSKFPPPFPTKTDKKSLPLTREVDLPQGKDGGRDKTEEGSLPQSLCDSSLVRGSLYPLQPRALFTIHFSFFIIHFPQKRRAYADRSAFAHTLRSESRSTNKRGTRLGVYPGIRRRRRYRQPKGTQTEPA